MQLLLDEKYAPITWSTTFVKAPLDTVYPLVEQSIWGTGTTKGPESRVPVSGTLDEMLAAVASKGLHPLAENALLVDCDPWVAIFGTHPRAMDFALRGLQPHEHISIRCLPTMSAKQNDGDPRFGVMGFERRVGAEQDDTYQWRDIRAFRDDQWIFNQIGDPLPCENLADYDNPKIKARLTSAMIGRYCEHFGISPFDPEWYGHTGVIFECQRTEHEQAECLTLAQAQEENHINPGLAAKCPG